MSTNVENYGVKMNWDDAQFQAGVKRSLSTLEKFKSEVDFKKCERAFDELEQSAKNVDLSVLLKPLESINKKLGAVSGTFNRELTKMVNNFVNGAKKMIKSVSIDQIGKGWTKFEDKTQSVQTIMAATGEEIDKVTNKLEQLMWFADETSYNFNDMVANIGKFTANGVGLDQAVKAMEGISNWAAISGRHAQEAGRVMYNLSQALSIGAVKLMDWKSVELANMATQEFKETAIETAVELKMLKKEADGTVKTIGKGLTVTANSFRETLKEEWFNNQVLLATLDKYSNFTQLAKRIADESGLIAIEINRSVDAIKNKGKTLEEVGKEFNFSGHQMEVLAKYMDQLTSAENDLGFRSFKAAQEAISFKQAIEATQDAVSSKWSKTFELIIGDYEHAKVVWSDFAEILYDIFAESGNVRNELLQTWNWLGGRDDLIDGLFNAIEHLREIISPFTEAFRNIFPEVTAERLVGLTYKFRLFTEQLDHSEERLGAIREIAVGLFKPVEWLFDIFKKAFPYIRGFFLTIIWAIKTAAKLLSIFNYKVDELYKAGKLFDIVRVAAEKFGAALGTAVMAAVYALRYLVSLLPSVKSAILYVIDAASDFYDLLSKWDGFKGIANRVLWYIEKTWGDIKAYFKLFIDLLTGPGLQSALPKILSAIGSFIERATSYILGKIKSVFKSVSGEIPALVEPIRSAITKMISGSNWFGEFIGKFTMSGLAAGIIKYVGLVLSAVRTAIGQIKAAFLRAFQIHSPSLWGESIGMFLMSGIGAGIRKYVGLVIESISVICQRIGATFENLIYKIGVTEAIRTMLDRIVGGFRQFVLESPRVVSAIERILNYLDALHYILATSKSVRELFSRFGQLILGLLTDISTDLDQFYRRLSIKTKLELRDLSNQFLDLVDQLVDKVIDGFYALIPKLPSPVKLLLETIRDDVQNLISGDSWFSDWFGENLALGIESGVFKNIETVADAMLKFAQAMMATLCNAFGIHSPSLWGQNYLAMFLMAGIAIGIIKWAKLTIPSIQETCSVIGNAFTTALSKISIADVLAYFQKVASDISRVLIHLRDGMRQLIINAFWLIGVDIVSEGKAFISWLFNLFVNAYNGINNKINAFNTLLDTFRSNVVNKAIEIASKASNAIKRIIDSFIVWLSGAISTIGKLAKYVYTNAKAIFGKVFKILTSVFNSISKLLSSNASIRNLEKNRLFGIFDKLIPPETIAKLGVWGKAIENVVSILKKVFSGVVDFLAMIKTSISPGLLILLTFAFTLGKLISRLWKLIGIIMPIIPKMVNLTETLFNAGTLVFTSMFRFIQDFKNVISAVAQVITEGFGTLVAELAKIPAELAKIPGLFNDLMKEFIKTQRKKAFAEIVKAFALAIVALAGALYVIAEFVDYDKLDTALVSLAKLGVGLVVFAGVMGVLNRWAGVDEKFLITISAYLGAITFMLSQFKAVSELTLSGMDVAKVVGYVASLVLVYGLFAKYFGAFGGVKLIRSTAGLVIFAVAAGLFIKAFTKFIVAVTNPELQASLSTAKISITNIIGILALFGGMSLLASKLTIGSAASLFALSYFTDTILGWLTTFGKSLVSINYATSQIMPKINLFDSIGKLILWIEGIFIKIKSGFAKLKYWASYSGKDVQAVSNVLLYAIKDFKDAYDRLVLIAIAILAIAKVFPKIFSLATSIFSFGKKIFGVGEKVKKLSFSNLARGVLELSLSTLILSIAIKSFITIAETYSPLQIAGAAFMISLFTIVVSSSAALMTRINKEGGVFKGSTGAMLSMVLAVALLRGVLMSWAQLYEDTKGFEEGSLNAGIVSVIGGMFILVQLIKILGNNKDLNLKGAAVTMLALVASVYLLNEVVKSFAKFAAEQGKTKEGIYAMVGAAAAILSIMVVLGLILKTANNLKGSAMAIVSLSLAVAVIAVVIGVLAAMPDQDKVLTAAIAMGIGLFGFAQVLAAAGHVMLGSLPEIIALGAIILLLTGALANLSYVAEDAKSMLIAAGAIASVLLGLAAALFAAGTMTQAALPGIVAMGMLLVGMYALLYSLQNLNGESLISIATAMGILFGALAVAGFIANFAAPGLGALAAVMGALGVSLLAISAAAYIFAAAFDLVVNTLDHVLMMFPEMSDTVQTCLTTILTAFTNLISTIFDVGANIVAGLGQGILSGISLIGSVVRTVVDYIKGLFTGKDGFVTHSPSLWAQDVLGNNIILGLGQGLLSGLSYLGTTITSVVDYVKASFQNLFGIHSASEWFHNIIGWFSMVGMGEGMVDATNNAVKFDIGSICRGISDWFKSFDWKSPGLAAGGQLMEGVQEKIKEGTEKAKQWAEENGIELPNITDFFNLDTHSGYWDETDYSNYAFFKDKPKYMTKEEWIKRQAEKNAREVDMNLQQKEWENLFNNGTGDIDFGDIPGGGGGDSGSSKAAKQAKEDLVEYTDIVQVAKGAIDRFNRAYGDKLKKTFEDTTETIDIASVAMEQLANQIYLQKVAAMDVDKQAEELSKSAEVRLSNAYKAFKEYRDKIKTTIAGQIDFFGDTLDVKDEKGPAGYLKSMHDMLLQTEEYAQRVRQLGERGVSEGLYNALVSKGFTAEGFKQVKAFSQMSDEQIKEANELYERLGTMPDEIADTTMAGMANVAMMATEGWIKGFDQNAGINSANAFTSGLITTMETNLKEHSPSKVFMDIAANVVEGFKLGIDEDTPGLLTRMSQMAFDLIRSFSEKIENLKPGVAANMWNAGLSAVQGFAKGIRENVTIVQTAAAEVANAAYESAMAALDANSPSKLMSKVGLYADQGLAIGLSDNSELVANASANVGARLYANMHAAIQRMNAMITGEIDPDPVITPTLNLSRISAGASQIGAMFNNHHGYNLDATSTEGDGSIQNRGMTFVQNNYSPKALSRIEIYRQTKNQFAYAKGVIG